MSKIHDVPDSLPLSVASFELCGTDDLGSEVGLRQMWSFIPVSTSFLRDQMSQLYMPRRQRERWSIEKACKRFIAAIGWCSREKWTWFHWDSINFGRSIPHRFPLSTHSGPWDLMRSSIFFSSYEKAKPLHIICQTPAQLSGTPDLTVSSMNT